MMTALTVAAARRALSCRRRALRPRPHPGAVATIVDGSNGNANAETRISRRPISILRKQYNFSSAWPTTTNAHGNSAARRTFSTDSMEAVSSHVDAIESDRSTSDDATATAETTSAASSTPSLTEEEYDPAGVVSRIRRAAKWDQGRMPNEPNSNIPNRRGDERKWDYEFVRSAADDYERHLRYVLDRLDSKKGVESSTAAAGEDGGRAASGDGDDPLSGVHPSPTRAAATHDLLSPRALSDAVRALTRSRADTPILSRRVRDVERLVGSIGWTPITEELSYRLLEANGKAGNVRRTLALLELRRMRGYAPRSHGVVSTTAGAEEEEGAADDEVDEDGGDPPQNNKRTGASSIEPGEREFIHAITSIQSAQLPLRRSRNIYVHESSLPESALDNPTNYLDAILINMSRRNVPLRPEMANRMLGCYASTGRTGRALHYFYKVVRDPVEEDGYYIPGPHPTHLGREELEEWKEGRRREGAGRVVVSGFEGKDGGDGGDASGAGRDDGDPSIEMEALDGYDGSRRRTKTRMIMHPPPPFHKMPSSVKGHRSRSRLPNADPDDKEERKTKYEWELEREWSPSLAAAFAFADSLTHGACGHDPIELDVSGWNALIKACCHRGAFHRALGILDETMPRRGIEPDGYTYNTVLSGLARVGDVALMRERLTSMTNGGVGVDKYTVQAMADGCLNAGDVAGASSVVQDVFNQHDALPPYTTHLKVVEHALACGLVHEAKRHVYFVQQLWKWRPSPHHDEGFRRTVEETRRNPKLSKGALQKLFRHFHEDLREEDFF